MLLSEAYEKYDLPTHYAVCKVCNTAWIDDMPRFGTLMCPKCAGIALARGYEDPISLGFTMDSAKPEEPPYFKVRFKVRCVGCNTPYLRQFETIYGGEACPACGVYVYAREEDIETTDCCCKCEEEKVRDDFATWGGKNNICHDCAENTEG